MTGFLEDCMHQEEEFNRLIREHDDMERYIFLAEDEIYPFLKNMLPIELFLQEQWARNVELTWNYAEKQNELNRFVNIPSGMSIQISRHFRYDCSKIHKHHYFQLNYVLEGETVIHCGNEQYTVFAGDFFLLAPDVPHCVDSFGDDILLLKVYIRYSTFEKTFFRFLGENNVLTAFFRRVLYEGTAHDNYICFHTGNRSGLREYMLETYRLFMNRVEYLDVIMECRITELFCTLVRLYMETAQTNLETGESAGIGKILNYIRKQYVSATLEETAAWAGYSKNYLCRLLKKSTGKTYTELLNAVRMEKACQMLVQTELPAGKIAVTIGYGTVKHFYRVFREMIGMTPQQYRKSHTCEL